MAKSADNLDALVESLKGLNQQLADLPATTKVGVKKALEKNINALKSKIQTHKDSNTAQGVIKVRFLKSPTGDFNLAYNAGETGDLSADMAVKCIDAGFAKQVK